MYLLALAGKDKFKRKTFVAREDLIDCLSRVAKNKGCSLYSLVNEVFEVFLKAEDAGLDLRRVLENFWIFEKAKRAGFILGLESLWYDMADLVHETAFDKALKSWFEAGVWFAKRYSVMEGARSLEASICYLRCLAWNISELNVERVNGCVHLSLVCPKFTVAFTQLFKSFLCGLLDSYGYMVVEEEVGRGIIRLEAVEKNGET